MNILPSEVGYYQEDFYGMKLSMVLEVVYQVSPADKLKT